MNFDQAEEQLEVVCRTEALCGQCAGKECLVGYAKYCLAKMRGVIPPFMEGGFESIPAVDIRGSYDEYDVLHTIAQMLNECHACKENHKDDCVINIVRGCMEVIAFGDEQEFEGNPLPYMMAMGSKYPEQGAIILEEYRKAKEETN